VKHLFTRRFTDRVAVANVDLTIEAGEAVAYVGPNGAGKSTTIKMLTGILVPTSGEVHANGVVPHKQRIQNARNIGVVFGQRTQLWWDIPVRESLALLKEIHRIPQDRYEATLQSFNELLELGELLPVIGRRLSLGQRMRADLAAALLHDPKILYLDEPTIGLDISVKDRVRAFIKQLIAERGTTVMLTTHDLGDIEDICRRIVIIDEGRIIYDGDLQAVKDTFARERSMHFQLHHPPADPAAIAARVPGVASRSPPRTWLRQ
jgi:ABC-2 type transport system ATP-binding protein